MSALRKVARYFRNRTFSVSEVCAIAGLSTTQVNNAIAELAPLGIVCAGNGARSVEYRGLFAIRLVNDMAGWKLSMPLRKAVISAALQSKKASIDVPGLPLAVRVDAYRKEASSGLDKLYQAEELVSSTPAIMQGEPCIRGTRTPAHEVAGVARSSGMEEALLAYPHLDKTQIELACVYASAYPRRGRPKTVKDHLPDKIARRTRTVVVD
jgi:uncharacterized protein (DUF433 family)